MGDVLSCRRLVSLRRSELQKIRSADRGGSLLQLFAYVVKMWKSLHRQQSTRQAHLSLLPRVGSWRGLQGPVLWPGLLAGELGRPPAKLPCTRLGKIRGFEGDISEAFCFVAYGLVAVLMQFAVNQRRVLPHHLHMPTLWSWVMSIGRYIHMYVHIYIYMYI